MAGFIPVDQSLAKLSARNNVAKYNLANQEAPSIKGMLSQCHSHFHQSVLKELQQNNIFKLF